MFSKDDRKYLDERFYSMALEKFFARELELYHYFRQNDYNSKIKKVRTNLAIEKVYPFTNENLLELFKQLDVKDKSVATSGSSGDQILAALLFGAKKVTLIDGNLYSKHFIDYKFSAIKNLTYEEFVEHFINHKDYFNFEVFKKICHDLDPDSFTFWGTIYSSTDNSLEIRNKITNGNNERPKTDFLFNKDIYLKLQEILKAHDFELDFKIAEFNDFPEVLTEDNYAAILLSNIHQYVNSEDYTRVVSMLLKKLAPGGKIQLNYDFPKMFNKPATDKTSAFKDKFPENANNIYSIKFENDRLYFLEKPIEKEPNIFNHQ